MAKNLPKPMPASATFTYDLGTGKKQPDVTKKIKGGDLRAKPGQNNGR
ncbi:MAG: hypothetical protein A4E53_00154 [Pelotomaculum sp. PtaB.Bin104]|nr:MAG: hypothetical protein A4E53_00154 [Pelotomaculum sp. PtaB.Bin104]